MNLITTFNNYNYYQGWDGVVPYYNIVPCNSKPPSSGYYNRHYILAIKHLPDLFI